MPITLTQIATNQVIFFVLQSERTLIRNMTDFMWYLTRLRVARQLNTTLGVYVVLMRLLSAPMPLLGLLRTPLIKVTELIGGECIKVISTPHLLG